MKLDRKSLKLYAVTDRFWLKEGETLEEKVRQAIEGGATFVQLREKDLEEEAFYELALKVKAVCSEYHVPFVIDDDVVLAKKVGADGVHVGQRDMELENARKILGPEAIIGVSAQTVYQALEAEAHGADYLGVGAVFATATKDDADDVSHDTLQEICTAVKIPVIAIGGITEENLPKLKGRGIDGIAVVSAIFGQADVKKATKRLDDILTEIL